MAHVQRVGDPQDRRQLVDHQPLPAREAGVHGVRHLRQRPAVVAHHVGDHRRIPLVDAEHLGVGDDVGAVLVVARGLDQLADLVQQRCHVQQQALAVPQSVILRQQVEQVQRQLRDVADVRVLGVVLARHAQRRRDRLPLELTARLLVVEHHAQQHALANAQLRDDHLLGGGRLQEQVVDDQVGQDALGVLVGDLQLVHQLLDPQVLQTADQLLERRALDEQAVLGDPPPRARGRQADHAAARHEPADVLERLFVAEHLARRGHGLRQHAAQPLRIAVHRPQHALHAGAAQLQRVHECHPAAAQQHELGAAGADLHDQGVGTREPRDRRLDGVHGAQIGQPVLLHAVDHPHVQSGTQRHPVDEGVAVLRLAQRGGGDHGGFPGADPPTAQKLLKGRQRFQRYPDRRAAGRPGAEHVVAERDRPIGTVEDADGAGGIDLGDHHADGAGADVDYRPRRAVAGVRRLAHARDSCASAAAPRTTALSPSVAATTSTPSARDGSA